MILNTILYLFYGLVFLTMGIAVFSRDTRLSELGIARILWLLAVFGIVHGLHEWAELIGQLSDLHNNRFFAVFRLFGVAASYLFLLYFGLFINIITIYGDKALKSTPAWVKAVIGTVALAVIVIAIHADFGSGRDLYVRRYVAFPGALLSGLGLIFYSRTVKQFSGRVATNFILAGIFMTAYSIFAGLIPSDFIVPIINLKIILFRSISGFLFMFFTIRALSVFNIEQQEIINDQLLRFSQSEKLTSIGILAAGIAHEINNPLTNASLNVEMLRDLVGGTEKVDRKLESIERNISRASTIASELLQFSQERETSLEPVDINEVIRSAVNLLTNQERISIIRLSLKPVPEILGVYHKLEEVFINVLMNSFDACGEDDYIEIETLVDGGSVMAVVTDTGAGVSSSMISRVFDPFFTTKKVGKGTGLGLSVCQSIIDQHGGTISLRSSTAGGAVVTITIPEADQHE